ncbi:MAG TPA: hydroxyisourate hydrolase [Kofleriaceae bacterium]|jgi:5-hydroxyisourate hydrolase|nr:hydroxyisourate hydrolase [Kofleriaceae bacterium]
MITTHVLDTALGRPGPAIAIDLERNDDGLWELIGAGATDDDGRLRTLTAGPVAPGTYRLRFHTAAYFAARHGGAGFFPVVEIQFTIADGEAHYHVPLLLSPFGYSTYRGS